MNRSRELALLSLRNRVKNAKTLVICDPYILTIREGDDPEDYVHQLREVLPESLSKLVLVHSQTKENHLMREIIIHTFPNSLPVHIFKCSAIHDRVWIVDNKSAFVTGTSFNSIGYRLSFIIDLDKDDFKDFWHFLVTELGDEFKNSLFK